MSSLYVKINALNAGSGQGGEGKCKGRKAVGFEPGTRVDWKFTAMKEGLSSQVSGFLLSFINSKYALTLFMYVPRIKRVLCR